MDISLCNGCRQRNALIAGLETRVAQLEAEVTRQRQIAQRSATALQRLTERLAQYEPEVRRKRETVSPVP